MVWWNRRKLTALIKVNRLPTTVSYNIAYFLVGAALAGPGILTDRIDLAIYYTCAIFLVKMQASVADAIHDQQADAANPVKSKVARAVMVLGGRLSWSLLIVELVVALTLFGYVSLRTGSWLYLAVGATFALLGFGYSYPPRLKERGVINHVVTTGTDVGFVVLAFTYLLTDVLPTRSYVVGSVIFLYVFAYHLMHQAADTHYDIRAGIRTFATRAGPARTVAVAGVFTAGAAGISLALGYFIAAIALLLTTIFYLRLYSTIRTLSLKRQTDHLSERFDIARVATALNLALALSIIRKTIGPAAIPLL